jgi:hypothetical protein
LHYSLRTEQAYVHWVRAFVRFHGLRHPKAMGQAAVEAFLCWLSNDRGVSVSTHRLALAALLFPYQQAVRHRPCFSRTAPQTRTPCRTRSHPCG